MIRAPASLRCARRAANLRTQNHQFAIQIWKYRDFHSRIKPSFSLNFRGFFETTAVCSMQNPAVTPFPRVYFRKGAKLVRYRRVVLLMAPVKMVSRSTTTKTASVCALLRCYRNAGASELLRFLVIFSDWRRWEKPRCVSRIFGYVGLCPSAGALCL